MKNYEKIIMNELRERCDDAGSSSAFARNMQLNQSTVSKFMRGNQSIANMPLRTLFDFFPDAMIGFNGADPSDTSGLVRDLINEIRTMNKKQLLQLATYIEDQKSGSR